MSGRPITEQQRSWLQDEVQFWREKALVTAEQAGGILDLYQTRSEVAAQKHSLALNTLMAVASLLIGLAALLVVGYNWEAMPAPVKLVIVFGVTFGTHGLACFMRYRRAAPRLSEVLFFLGCLFYGAGIFLVAQIFHLNSHYPNGIWWWAMGVLPFALCLDAFVLHALLATLLALWAGMEVFGFADLGMWLFGRWGYFPNGAYSLPLLAIPGLLTAYRHGSLARVALYVPLLVWWAVLQPFAWHWEEDSIYFIGAAGAALLVLAECHRVGNPMALPYRVYGALLAGGVLVPLSFYDAQQQIVRDTADGMSIVAAIVIAVSAAAAAAVVVFLRERHVGGAAPGHEHRDRLWAPIGFLLLMALLPLWNGVAAEALGVVVPTILCNAAMLALAVWLMRVGLSEDRGRPFAVGVLYFLLWVVLRYFDLFGDFGGMLGAALMFALCGGGLFAVAWYWRNRKEVQHA